MKKKKTKRADVPVHEVVLGGLPQAELQKVVEKEYEMALQDRVMEETKDKKNAVEAYVYDMRNKVQCKASIFSADLCLFIYFSSAFALGCKRARNVGILLTKCYMSLWRCSVFRVIVSMMRITQWLWPVTAF